jgi:hypothetical protein
LANIKGIQTEQKSFTGLYLFNRENKKDFQLEKMYCHPSGKMVLFVANEINSSNPGSSKSPQLLFYDVDRNETYFEKLNINFSIQCIEFMDDCYPYSNVTQDIAPQLRDKFYSMLIGCKNGDLFYVEVLLNEPFRLDCSKIYSFVMRGNSFNAELSSLKKIKLFIPKQSDKK